MNDYHMDIINSKVISSKGEILIVRVDYRGDRGFDKDFLNFIYGEYPVLKDNKLLSLTDFGEEHLSDWNCGNPKAPFMSVIAIFGY